MSRGLGRESGSLRKPAAVVGGANPGAVVRRDGVVDVVGRRVRGKKHSWWCPTGNCGDGQEWSKAGE
ncbi:hypothetical protein L2E82_51281 [Cichorium intybus]|nr:hypothetical protein L2E82_51281 [Cichorium intybus]